MKKSIIINSLGHTKSVEEPADTTELKKQDNQEEDAKLRAIAVMELTRKLEQRLKEIKADFDSFVEKGGFDLKENRDDIMGEDIFLNYYFTNQFTVMFLEIRDGDLQPKDDAMLYSTVVIFYQLYFTQKWNIQRIINYFKQRSLQMMADETYQNNAIDDMDKFYDQSILKDFTNDSSVN